MFAAASVRDPGILDSSRRYKRRRELHPGEDPSNYWTWRDREWTHVTAFYLERLSRRWRPRLEQEWEPHTRIDYVWFFPGTIVPAAVIEHENDSTTKGWMTPEMGRLTRRVEEWEGLPLAILITYEWSPGQISRIRRIRRDVETKLKHLPQKQRRRLAGRFLLVVGREWKWNERPAWAGWTWDGNSLHPV